MAFNKSFLEDEIRLGFYVPAAIKQAWAAELEIYEQIKKVCSENSISFFADWGTFLGAVRHNGFIPWDDDMDLVMLREDYDRFLKIAPDALPKGYSIHTFRNEEGFVEFHAVVVNTEHARFDEEHFNKFHGFPYTCGVDIFVLDFIHSNVSDETNRVHDVTYIIAFADGMLANKFNKDALASGFKKIESMCGVTLNRSKSQKDLWIELYELAEKKCAEVTKDKSHTITQMVPWGLKSQLNRRYSYDEYKNSIDIPFEYVTIPLPVHFNELLSRRYGNYMKLIKNAGAHDYPYFLKQKEELETLFGHVISKYSYKPSSITKRNSNDNWRDVINECLANLKSMTSCMDLQDLDLSELVCNSQQLAIDLGKYIESLWGENTESILQIENYCEELFKLYSLLMKKTDASTNALINSMESVSASFELMEKSIKENLLDRKKVVFLPFKADYWNTMSELYSFYKKQPGHDVYVVPIPYFYKNYDGTLSDMQYDLSSYPEEISPVCFEDYSLEFNHPDIIVFQSPYDEYNASTSVAPEFFSYRLLQCTESLIYVPWFTTHDFNEQDEREYKNMDYYVTMPGIVNADIVYVQSDILKETYIRKLIDWSGQNADWAGKIRVLKHSSATNACINSKKKFLYYIGISQPLENPETFLDKVNSSLNIFKENAERITVILYPDSQLFINLNKFAPKLSEPFKKLLSEFETSGYGELFEGQFTKELLNQCDGFYGDAGYIATIFADAKKPVMIQDYKLNQPQEC